MENDLSELLESWRRATRIEWTIPLAIVALSLPTCLTLYGELNPAKNAVGWVEVSVLSTAIPLVLILLYRFASQRRVSRKIVDTLLATGHAPVGLFDQLTGQERRLLQYKVLSSIPLRPRQSIAVAELVAKETDAREKALVQFQATVIFDLFQSLGFLESHADHRIAAVSEHAAAMLHCMALGVREQVTLLTNWRIRDIGDPAFKRAFEFISGAEDHRRALTRESGWMPVRKDIPVSLIMIKGVRDGVEEVLVRWSFAWETFNWVGGTQEIGDSDPLACAYRELNEELGLDRSGALFLDCIGSAASSPIKSARLGVYSTWKYTVFALNARSIPRGALPQALSRVIQSTAEFEVFTDQRRLTKIRWLRWTDIASDSDFANYGPELTRFLLDHFSGIAPTFSFDCGGP